MKNFTTSVKYCDFLCFSLIKKQPKFWPADNIELHGSS